VQDATIAANLRFCTANTHSTHSIDQSYIRQSGYCVEGEEAGVLFKEDNMNPNASDLQAKQPVITGKQSVRVGQQRLRLGVRSVSVSRATLVVRTGDNPFQLFTYGPGAVRPSSLVPGVRVRVTAGPQDRGGSLGCSWCKRLVT
jgi:hypothetical protein